MVTFKMQEQMVTFFAGEHVATIHFEQKYGDGYLLNKVSDACFCKIMVSLSQNKQGDAFH